MRNKAVPCLPDICSPEDPATREAWEKVGEQQNPSWYLDPLAAMQKREAHLQLIDRWSAGLRIRAVFKTDLFEEAFGKDRLLPGLFPDAWIVCGIDEAFSTARAAKQFSGLTGRVAVADVRKCCFKPGTFDLVLSTSTLDHFKTRPEFLLALRELHGTLRPGGKLILILDNPSNPLYPALKIFSRTRFAPYFLGYTPAIRTLRADLREAGYEVEAEDWLLHNPRLLSTALFLVIRRVARESAGTAISCLIRAFAQFGKLPTRRWTACFQAVLARKPLPQGEPK